MGLGSVTLPIHYGNIEMHASTTHNTPVAPRLLHLKVYIFIPLKAMTKKSERAPI